MNWDIIEGRWNQLKGSVRGRWAKLTDDDVAAVGAKKDQLVGRIQERYGVARDDAEQQVDQWIRRLGRGRSGRAESVPEAKGSAKG
jgi:uncharacterized protein YjbJ (UPF0337 family)